MTRPATVAQGEALDLAAERLVADARTVCTRVGADESDAITLLIHAASIAIADACGQNPPRDRIAKACDLAMDQIEEAVPAYVAERAKMKGPPRV